MILDEEENWDVAKNDKYVKETTSSELNWNSVKKTACLKLGFVFASGLYINYCGLFYLLTELSRMYR